MEVWKDIKGYEGLYQASSYGRIRTVDKKITHTKRHGKRVWKGRIMKYRGETIKTGYRVCLWLNGKPKDYLVSRLVAYTFYGSDYNDRSLTVNHKDGNRFNNKIENLEIISLAENVRHAFNTGLMRNSQRKTILQKDNQTIEFRSMGQASRFLNKNNGFISLLASRGVYEYKGYKIILKKKGEK